MKYFSKYTGFDAGAIKTYPLVTRANRVKLEHLIWPQAMAQFMPDLPAATQTQIEALAREMVRCQRENKPIVLFTGAHLIKNGLAPLIIELVQRKFLTLVAGNTAAAIHDFELALIGETSENVPDAVGQGLFGMASEFAFINAALKLGDHYQLGLGETLGKMICELEYRQEVIASLNLRNAVVFKHPEASLLASCYHCEIPFTIHATIGTDVIDQHPSFSARAKGGCSGRDFLIFVDAIAKFTEGGIFVNIGSAVTGPEVFLKAISMVTNVGKKPGRLLCADFDLRAVGLEQLMDENAAGYYFRDQKSVIHRIPSAFGGRGIYIQGNQKQTVPFLFKKIIDILTYES